MGQILSFLWRKKSLLDELSELDETIKSISEYSDNVERRHKTAVKWLFTAGVLLVIFGGIYLYLVPSKTIKETIIYSAVLFVISILLMFLREVMSWYYQMKIKKNKLKLTKAKETKKNVIKKVMETETYNVAREILQKYSDDAVKMPTPGNQLVAARTEVRRRTGPLSATPSPVPYQSQLLSNSPGSLSLDQGSQGRWSFINKFAESLAGEGPYNRYALICTHCQGHNGLALEEEFPYLSFRCMHCHKLNQARKSRPTPPRLESQELPEDEQNELQPGGESETDTQEEEDRENTNNAIQNDSGEGVEEADTEERSDNHSTGEQVVE